MTPGRGWVLVTGATRGIGEATAKLLADNGFDLILWARTAGDLAVTAKTVRAAGAEVRTAAVDVGDAAAVEAASRDTLAEINRLAGVVLNAGHGVWTPLKRLGLAEWHSTVDTNLNGAFHVLRAAIPRLGYGGLVVGVLSDSVLYPFPDRAAYSAAKSGMSALLDVARRELRPVGVRICSLLPSRVDTHFEGAHEVAGPGSRPGALAAAEVAEVVCGLFDLPQGIEVRHIQLAAMASSYGPFPEVVER